MESLSMGLVIAICIAALLVGAIIGFFIGRRTANDQKQIRELQGLLANSKSEHEAYRQQVNNHFQKTSELFGRMTDSYKTVFLHLAEGSEQLCSSDAAKLKPVSDSFPSLEHKRQEQVRKEEKQSTVESADRKTDQTGETPHEEKESRAGTTSSERSESAAEEKKESSRPEQQREEEKSKEPA